MGAWPLPTGDSLVVPSRAQVYLIGPVVNGVKQRALFGWYSHLCTANGPSAKAMGTHGPLDPAAPEGKTGAARDGPREACLMSADPWDTGQ
jgi:hypothetical protein